jgi:hypothetical protein
LLTAANRLQRDHRVEERLLELRFQAFEQADWPTVPPPWPTDVPDLFSGVLIPEVAAKDLTVERLRSAITWHGSLLVRGVISEGRAQALIDDTDRAFEAFDARKSGADSAALAPWFVPYPHEPDPVQRQFRRDAGGVLAVDSPPAMYDVIETFEDAGLGALINGYFCEESVLLARKWTLRCVAHTEPQSPWHQDGTFMGRDIRSLNVWLSLSHCGDDAPGLDVVGRRLSDLVETGTEGAMLHWVVGEAVAERAAEGSIVRPIFRPGDALLFDHMNLHRTAVDASMTRDRYAVEAWFFAPSTFGAMTADFDGRDTLLPRDQLPIVY